MCGHRSVLSIRSATVGASTLPGFYDVTNAYGAKGYSI